MKTNLKNLVALGIVLAVLGMAGIAGATTTAVTWAAETDGTTMVGGMPVCIAATGTSAASADDVVLTTPPGFNARTVEFIPDYDATNPNVYLWRYGMSDNSAIIVTGSTGVYTYSLLASAYIDSDTGTITIGSGIQINSGNFLIRACR